MVKTNLANQQHEFADCDWVISLSEVNVERKPQASSQGDSPSAVGELMQRHVDPPEYVSHKPQTHQQKN